MKRLGTILIWVLVTALVVAGCGQGASDAPAPGEGAQGGDTQPAAGGTFNISFRYPVPSPDPHDARTITHHILAALVSEPLVRWGDNGFEGALAEDWEVSPDAKVYTFHLREGVKFHNGEPLTAEAVKASIERITDPSDPKPTAGSLADVERVEVVDDLTVRFHLKNANPDFLGNLLLIWILEPGSWENLAEDEAPAGTGPFTITEFVPDQRVVLEPFADYWAGKPYLDQIVIRSIPDADTQLVELEAGTVDFADYVPPKEVRRLEAAGFKPLPFVRVNWARLAINLERLDNVEFRKALCYAIDFDEIREVAYAGFGIPMKTIGVPDSWLYNDQVPGYEYDPERAKAILDENGWVDSDGDGIREMDGKPIRLHFPSRGDGEWLLSTQMIQQMLREIGIDSNITTAPPDTYYTQVRTGDYDIAWWLSNSPPEPPIAATNLHSAQYWNVMQVAIPEVDELIDKAKGTVDQEERAEYYRQLQQLHYDLALECLGFWMEQAHVVSGQMEGVVVDPLGVLQQAHLWRKSSD